MAKEKRRAKAVPERFHTVSPHLTVRDASRAIDFYKRAFGAEELKRHLMPDGRTVMYALIRIGDSMVHLNDEMPMMQHWLSPQALGGTTVGLHLYVEDVDALFGRAVAAGATVVMPPMDAFWGDRYGRVRDPFGHEWSVATHVADLTDEEIARGAEEFFSKLPKP